MDNFLERVERLISEINKLHEDYSTDYFDTAKVEKVNLSRTIGKIPVAHILNYRLNLHESINDYLMRANLDDVKYYYRVKTSESIVDKINRFANNDDQYPVNNWLNDILCCRIILNSAEIEEIENHLDCWQEKYGLKNWYKRDKDGYKAIHVYFKNKNNFYFPWELQIWDESDVESNIEAHQSQKRFFV